MDSIGSADSMKKRGLPILLESTERRLYCYESGTSLSGILSFTETIIITPPLDSNWTLGAGEIQEGRL